MHDVAEFLGGHEPFDGLDHEALEEIARRTEVEYSLSERSSSSSGLRAPAHQGNSTRFD
jgi:hypothetical protein